MWSDRFKHFRVMILPRRNHVLGVRYRCGGFSSTVKIVRASTTQRRQCFLGGPLNSRSELSADWAANMPCLRML